MSITLALNYALLSHPTARVLVAGHISSVHGQGPQSTWVSRYPDQTCKVLHCDLDFGALPKFQGRAAH